MKRMCRGRGLVILLVGLAGLGAVLVLLVTGRSGPEAKAQEAAQEADGAAVEQSIGDQIRQLMTDGENPQGAIAAAVQYLAAQPEVTLERQRVHYELAAAQWYAGDEDAALATFTQIVALYANAELDRASDEYRVDNALYFAGVMNEGYENTATAIEAFEALIAQFPASDCRPQAVFRLAYLRARDDQLEQAGTLAQALLTQYAGSEFEAGALRWAVCYLLSPEANPPVTTEEGAEEATTDDPHARNLQLAVAAITALTTNHPNAPETSLSWQDLLGHYLGRNEIDSAKLVARRTIELYYNADPKVAGDPLWSAAFALLDHPAPIDPTAVGPTPATEERAVATAALVRFVAQRPGASCPPQALCRLACVRAEDGDLAAGRALAESLTTRYAGTDLEPEALAAANHYWLSKEANPTKADRALNYETVRANTAALVARFPGSPETCGAHEELLWYHLGRFENAAAEPVAQRIIQLLPGTRPGMGAQKELAQIVVAVREDYATAYALLDEALAWARANGDVGFEAEVLWSRERILVLEGRCAESRAGAQEVIAMARAHEEAAWLLVPAETDVAYGWYMEEQYARAAEEFTRIIEQYPDEKSWLPFWKYYVGRCWCDAGDRAKAKEAWTRLVVEHPDADWAYAAWELAQAAGDEIPKPSWTPPASWGIDQ